MSATRPPAFDDRFTTPIEASRRGAHRARPKPVSAGLPIIAGIAVVLLVLGGTYTLLSPNGSSKASPNVAAADPGDDDSGADPTTKATATKAGSAPAKTTGKADSAPTSKAAAPGGDVDRGIALKVLNSVSTSGLAKKVVAEKIEPKGWKVASTGNSLNRNLDVTKIYYGKDANKATADAMKTDLGFGTVVKDTGVAGSGLVVVLGHDAE
jgi:hypothetical protein